MKEAGRRWVSACLEVLAFEAAPFVAEAATAEVPSPARLTKGIWLRGRRDGVRAGLIVRDPSGNLARVETVEESFSAIQDVADPEKKIPAGQRFAGTIVEKPSLREEPRIRLRWVGGEPSGLPLSSAQMLELTRAYLSKERGFRVLPLESGLERLEAYQEFSRTVSRASGLVSRAGLTLHRETLLQAAMEEPDFVVATGLAGTYQGERTTPDGIQESLFRVTLPTSIERREGAVYVLDGFDWSQEETSFQQMKGVRIVRPEDLWFTTVRNAVIHLAPKVAKRLSAARKDPLGQSERRGIVRIAGKVDWQGETPDLDIPLTWLRPAGEVRTSADSSSVGTLLEKIEPARGYLSSRELSGEALREGDELHFVAAGSASRHAALAVDPASVPIDGLASDWLFAMAAQTLSGALKCRFVSPSQRAPAHRLELLLSPLAVQKSEKAMTFSAEWRGRLYGGAEAAPALMWKWGVRSEGSQNLGTQETQFRPPDDRAGLIPYVLDALKALAARAQTKGVSLEKADESLSAGGSSK